MPDITHGQARRIAAEWHGGQSTALCALATSGHVNRDDLEREIAAEQATVQRPDSGTRTTGGRTASAA